MLDSLFNKVAGLRPATLWKRSCNTGVLLWNLRKFWEYLLLQNTSSGCFCLKTSNKIVWSNVFCYVKICIFWKCIQYTIQWDKTQILKNFPSDIINGTKDVLFFLSWAPTHHSFTFNLGLMRWLMRWRFVSLKLCVRFSIFDSVSFLLKFIFSFNKMVSGRLPPRKIAPRSGSGFGLGLALELGLGAFFLGGNFPRTQQNTWTLWL